MTAGAIWATRSQLVPVGRELVCLQRAQQLLEQERVAGRNHTTGIGELVGALAAQQPPDQLAVARPLSTHGRSTSATRSGSAAAGSRSLDPSATRVV